MYVRNIEDNLNDKIVLLFECMLSHFIRGLVFATLWIVAHQAPLSMGILQARILELVAVPSTREFSRPRD